MKIDQSYKRRHGVLKSVAMAAGIAVTVGMVQAEAATLAVPKQYTSIQAAVNAARSGDTIRVSAIHYQNANVVVMNYREEVKIKSKRLKLLCDTGSGGATLCRVQGSFTYSGSGALPNVEGFSFTPGSSNVGIRSLSSVGPGQAIVKNCEFKHLWSGIFVEGQSLTVTDSRFDRNTIGAMTGAYGTALSVTDSVFVKNDKGVSQGHYVGVGAFGDVTVRGSSFIDNAIGVHAVPMSPAQSIDIVLSNNLFAINAANLNLGTQNENPKGYNVLIDQGGNLYDPAMVGGSKRYRTYSGSGVGKDTHLPSTNWMAAIAGVSTSLNGTASPRLSKNEDTKRYAEEVDTSVVSGALSTTPLEIHILEAIDGMIVDNWGRVIGEAGNISASQPNQTSWNTLYLSRSYLNPVVVMQVMTKGDKTPAHIRVKSVGGNKVVYKIEHWKPDAAKAHAGERIGFIVIENGRHILADGRVIEAGRMLIDHNEVQQRFKYSIDAPVVATQVSSSNGNSPVIAQQRDVTNSGFMVRLREGKDDNGQHNPEYVGYVVTSAGSLFD